jgi:hypothetical protein
LIKKLNATNI